MEVFVARFMSITIGSSTNKPVFSANQRGWARNFHVKTQAAWWFYPLVNIQKAMEKNCDFPQLCEFTSLKNDGVRQWGQDDIPYMKWKIKFHGSKPPTRQGCCLGQATNHSSYWDKSSQTFMRCLLMKNGMQTQQLTQIW